MPPYGRLGGYIGAAMEEAVMGIAWQLLSLKGREPSAWEKAETAVTGDGHR